MISTKNLVFDVGKVPREWVFEYYLNLSEKLVGQDIKMSSVFKKDEVPSMFIYYDTTSLSYKYKDFSSGKQGNHISLVKDLLDCSTSEAILKILQDYNQYVENNNYSLSEIIPQSRYKVSDFLMRHWTNLDEKYWTPFNISSEQLENYNVVPLAYYKMSKEQNDHIKTIHIENNYLYGYFRNDGILYKIYQPKIKNKKFIKVRDYIQGSEQLTYKTKYLIITSSLKDLLSFNSLGIGNIESIAPDSENTMLPKNKMEEYLAKYNKVFILFDNDKAGKDSMNKYHKLYGTEIIILDMEKDLSDSIQKYGSVEVRNNLFSLIKNKLTKK